MSDHALHYSLLRYTDEYDSYHTDPEEDVEVFRSSHLSASNHCGNCSRCCKFAIALCLLLLVVVIITMGTLYSRQSYVSEQIFANQLSDRSAFSDWETQLEGTGSSSPLRVYDVNEDGVLDVILSANYDQPSTHSAQCQGTCQYGIMALDGHSGAVLWHLYTGGEIFELRCPAYDVDRDGVIDCIASGRHGTLVAFNPLSGVVLWSAPQDLNTNWNVFAPGLVRDVDGDGIDDMVVINGGDPSYTAHEHNRTASSMAVLSGSTGKVIGGLFTLHKNRESYSMPMIYTAVDDSQYIVYGTGGETVSGGLYILSLEHLLRHVSPHTVYNLSGGYKQWIDREDSTGTITLYRTSSKGVMVPASFADLDNDHIMDIVSLTFDGVLLAFSGKDLSHIWKPRNFTLDNINAESYTSPAFGYFNDDDIMDIMIHWQTGVWPSYDSLMIYIIDGSNGDMLWYKDTPIISDYTISAPLSLSTHIKYRNAFITRISSTNIAFDPETHENTDMTADGHVMSRRHFGLESSGITCDDIDKVFVDTVILDRTNSDSPLLLYRQHSQPYYYNITEELISQRIDYVGDSANERKVARRRHVDEGMEADEDYDVNDYNDVLNTVRCSLLSPRDISTGILSDLESDGVLDYIAIDVWYTKLLVRDEQPTGEMITKSVVRKFSLASIIQKLPLVILEDVVAPILTTESHITNLTLVNSTSQQFGPKQDGSY